MMALRMVTTRKVVVFSGCFMSQIDIGPTLLKGGPQLADRAETADHIHKDATDRYAPCLRALLFARKYLRLLLLCCTNNSKCNTEWYYLYL